MKTMAQKTMKEQEKQLVNRMMQYQKTAEMAIVRKRQTSHMIRKG